MDGLEWWGWVVGTATPEEGGRRLMGWDLQRLFRLHAGEILRSLRRRGFAEDVAADLTQDTFVRVIGAGQRLPDEGANPRAYLHAVSRNLAVDFVRREQRSGRVHLSEAALEAIADPAPSAETVVYDRQRLLVVERALAELPDETRRAFELYRLGEFTLAEVAGQLGCSTNKVWHLVRAAYAHLRLRLRDDAPPGAKKPGGGSLQP